MVTGFTHTTEPRLDGKLPIFVLFLLILIIGGALRSRIATRLDSFTYDEAYHIGAGAAYINTGDYRLNPEHPPLVKLWAGAFIASQGFHLSPFRSFLDKAEERSFVQDDVFVKNEPDAVQRRARTAMFALNGLLLLFFAFAVRRMFTNEIALAATAFLVIDPTISAHFPVVMTDLPLALLSATALLLAVHSFRTWRIRDLLFAGVALGLTLACKHSGLVTAGAAILAGLVIALVLVRKGASPQNRIARKLGSVALVGGMALAILWSTYLFRWHESPGTTQERFNRPLQAKINDLQSPTVRRVLRWMQQGRVVPRAYLWGLADTMRAGAEGRAISILAFGNLYYSRAPAYYFPGTIAAKLPIGLLILTVFGAVLALFRKIATSWYLPLLTVIGFSFLYLVVLMGGSSYAGVRHALPVYPALALLAACAVCYALVSGSLLYRAGVIVLLIAALLSALPAARPWEYYNELAGGPSGAHKYFNDEGIDLSHRTKEIASYYHRFIKPAGEIPFIAYFSPRVEWRRRGIDWVGRDPARDASRIFERTLTGTFIFGANQLAPALWWDFGKELRKEKPIARIGNVFIFRGTFPTPRAAPAYGLYYSAIHSKIYVARPDIVGAIEMLRQSLEFDPSAFFVSLELGNQYLKMGKREEALAAYRLSRANVPKGADEMQRLLDSQIKQVESEPLDQIELLRNPALE